MTTQLALPPIPTAPAPSSTLAAWQAYWDIAKMHRTQEREEAYDAEVLRHHQALEAAATRQAAAMEGQAAALNANAAAAAAHASNTGAIVARDQDAQTRHRADWILSVARDILVDRTSTTTSVTNRPKVIADSVADAIALVNAVDAALNPANPDVPA